jgi:hypothetical protein
MAEAQKANWFVRCLIMAFVIFLAYIVALSIIGNAPPYDVKTSIIILLAMMIILVLSESFNNFSLGKILILSREVQKTADEKESIKRENAELRQSLVQIATSIQSQINTTIQAQGVDWPRVLGVEKADSKEKEKEEERETLAIAETKHDEVSFYQLKTYIEELALKKYIERVNLPVSDIIRNIRFTESFEYIDPISNRAVTFDGYLKTPQKEYFFELQPSIKSGLFTFDRIYVKLSKILLYRQTKKIQAELIYIMAKIPEDKKSDSFDRAERFIQTFQPAIAGGLLRVEMVEINKEEYSLLESEFKKNAGK